jgi:hypothetical protein
MSVTLNLPPEIEKKLREQAANSAKTLEQYLQHLAEEAAAKNTAGTSPASAPSTLSPDEWVAEFRSWIAGFPKRDTVADDSRDSIYEGQGE